MSRERAAELLARLRVQDAFVKRAPRHAARGRAHAGPKRIERLQSESQAITWRADNVFGRDLAAFEFQFADRMRRDHFRSFAHRKTRHAR